MTKKNTKFAFITAILYFVEFILYYLGQLFDLIGSRLMQSPINVSFRMLVLVSGLYVLVPAVILLTIIGKKEKKLLVWAGLALAVYPIVYTLIMLGFSQKISSYSMIWLLMEVIFGGLVIVQSLSKKLKMWVLVFLFVIVGLSLLNTLFGPDMSYLLQRLTWNSRYLGESGDVGKVVIYFDLSLIFSKLASFVLIVANLFMLLCLNKSGEKDAVD